MTTQNPYQSPQTYSANDDDTQYEYAGFWLRAGASILDNLLIGVVVFVIAFALGYMGVINPDASSTADIVFEIILNVAALVFVVGCWIKYAGTPAKRLLGLKVLDADTGEHLTAGRAILRYIGYIPSTLVLLLGFIWVAFDKKKQGWHDKIANSVVVKESR